MSNSKFRAATDIISERVSKALSILGMPKILHEIE